MVGGPPDEGAAMLVAWGMTAEDAKRFNEAADDGIYPDNWPALGVMLALSTQWRVGMAGRTGLDYAALPAVLVLCGIRRKQRRDVFEAVRVMESEILRIESENRGR